MLLCVTPNPAIDRTAVVSNLRLDEVNRASTVHVAAGGKGVNVARAARTLGENVLCAGFLGGDHGTLFTALARREHLPGEWTTIDGETRSCMILLDPTQGHNTVINEMGPTVADEAWRQLIETVTTLSERASAVCLCGSAPPGTPLPRYAELLVRLREKKRTVWVDVAGEPLESARRTGGICLKVNRDEASVLAGRALDTLADIAQSAQMLVADGAPICIVTLGGEGAIMATEAGCWHATLPPIRRINAVGSGDSFLAGAATAQMRGESDESMLAWGVAAGAANAVSSGGGGFTYASFHALLGKVNVQPCS
ncbi:MAG: 1-phosphofructokinase family hexose kinase [Anaerolineae bacterium]